MYHTDVSVGTKWPSTYRIYGLLSYQVHGRTVETPVWLATCLVNSCMPYWIGRQGTTAEIAYDPKNVHRVEFGRVAKPFPNLLLIGLGVLLLAIGINNLFPDPGARLQRTRKRP